MRHMLEPEIVTPLDQEAGFLCHQAASSINSLHIVLDDQENIELGMVEVVADFNSNQIENGSIEKGSEKTLISPLGASSQRAARSAAMVKNASKLIYPSPRRNVFMVSFNTSPLKIKIIVRLV
jgi:hypothetical protein